MCYEIGAHKTLSRHICHGCVEQVEVMMPLQNTLYS